MLALTLVALLQITELSAQPSPIMGYVAAKNENPKRLEVFKKGLAELGYIEGKNIRIEYREAVLDAEYDGVVADLVDRKVDLILAANVAATRAAAKATKTIPIVMLAVFDPVGIGVSTVWSGPARTSPARQCTLPNWSGSVCGCSNASSQRSTKWQWL